MREELSKAMTGLGELIMFTNETRLVCGVTPSAKHVGYGCKVLSRLGWQILARSLRFLRPCTRLQEDEGNHEACSIQASEAILETREAIMRIRMHHADGHLAEYMQRLQ